MPYIYLVHCRACLNANERIYKIGKSIDFNKRLSGYDKGTVPIFSLFVSECDAFERHLIQIFETRFTLRKDYGNEYFEGDVLSMINIVVQEHEKENVVYTVSATQTTSISTNDATIQHNNMLKTKKRLLTQLNKVKMHNINDFRNGLGLNSNEFQMSEFYSVLFQVISRYITDTQNVSPTSNKLKFGHYAEVKSFLITNLSLSHDLPSIRLVERITQMAL
jgi:hypothetical protein